MKLLLAGLVGTAMAFAVSAQAQDISGTYEAADTSGAVVTFEVSQDSLGKVTGTLSTPSMTYRARGTLANGRSFGTMQGDSVTRFFEAVLHGSVLHTTLYEASLTGEPDYKTGELFLFQRLQVPPDSVVGSVDRDPALTPSTLRLARR